MSIKHPKVSIITPTLDRKDMLAGTIESVLAQGYTAIEHIVVDGGSSDSTIKLLQTYEKQHGIKWISEPDAGMYDALNKGLRMATGDIIGYLNTDDRYFPYTVAVAVDALEAASDIGFVYGDMLTMPVASEHGILNFFPPYRAASLRRGALLPQPTVFWTREVIEDCGLFDDSLALAGDMEYWIRISKTFTGKKIDEVQAYEMHHSGRLTYGQSAGRRAMVELATSVARHNDASQSWASRLWSRLYERARTAFWYRSCALRLLLSSWQRKSGEPGSAWQGFLIQERFRISKGRVAFALVPFLGRRYKAFVEELR